MAGAAGTAWRQADPSWPVPVTVRLQGVDFACTADFAAAMGLGPDGAILVRPDGHILALASSAGAKAERQLVDALANYLAITAIPATPGQARPVAAIS